MRRLSSLVLATLFMHGMRPAHGENQFLPECATSCWNDSMYVSLCLNDWACLCDESSYQNALFQCLYAQCDAIDFGMAIHCTVRQCAENGIHIRLTTTTSHQHELLKRSEEAYARGHVILDASGVATESGGLPTASAGLPTLSNAGNTPSSTVTIPTPSSTGDGNVGVVSTATPTVPSSEPVEGTPTSSSPFLFTGAAERLELRSGSSIGGIIVASLAGLYLTL